MLVSILNSITPPGITPDSPESRWIVMLLILTTIVTPTWLAWWNSRVAKKQVTTNGGSSMKDAVDKMVIQNERIETKVDLAATKVELATARVEKHDGQITAINDKLNQLVAVAMASNTQEITLHVEGELKT